MLKIDYCKSIVIYCQAFLLQWYTHASFFSNIFNSFCFIFFKVRVLQMRIAIDLYLHECVFIFSVIIHVNCRNISGKNISKRTFRKCTSGKERKKVPPLRTVNRIRADYNILARRKTNLKGIHKKRKGKY